MASETEVRIKAVINGLEGVKGLSSSVKKLQQSTRPANLEIKKLANDTAKLARSSDITEKELRASVFTMRELRDNTRIASDEYRRFTREIERAEKRLRSLNKTGRSGGKFGAAAGVVGGSALLGPDAFAGGLAGIGIGSMLGNPLAGASVGVLAGNMIVRPLREAASGVAEYNAKLNLSKIALAAASDNLDEYKRSLSIARKVSSDYTVDLLDTLDGYSKINAAAKANNLTMEETEDIFRGVISAGVAFGGSQADLQALIRATTQVLSKGKVSAEEMQGQIGERLPGAVAKFAEATGRELPELAKAFELGEVTIADFVKFSKKQVQTYDEVARTIGSSPEKAGKRLKLVLDTAKENYGSFFTSVGADTQDFVTRQISKLNENQESIKQFVTDTLNISDKLFKALKVIVEEAIGIIAPAVKKTLDDFILNPLKEVQKLLEDQFIRNKVGRLNMVKIELDAMKEADKIARQDPKYNKFSFGADFIKFRDEIAKGIKDKKIEEALALPEEDAIKNKVLSPLQEVGKELENIFAADGKFTSEGLFAGLTPENFAPVKDELKKLKTELNDFAKGAIAGANAYASTIKTFSESVGDAVNAAFKKMEDTLVNFVMTGKLAFRDLASSIIESMARIAIQQTIMKPFTGWFEGLFSAKGNVLQDGKHVTKYAKGGTIIDKPHYKMMANGGIAVAGEVPGSSEAILPLKRGRGGRLGVEASGGGIGNIVVNVDAAGTSVSNDEGRAEMLGRMIGMAVESEMLKQKRPGGLLYT